MKRCGLYTRVSTEDQVRVKDGSLDTQIDLLQDYVALRSRSGEEDWRIAARYREEGRSGKDPSRPQYRQLLDDVRSGKIDTVLCTKIDRVSRSLPNFYELLETLEEHDAAFVSLSEQLDTSTATGRAVLKILLVVAELEREQTSERTSQKAAWRASKGLKNGGQILGYDVDPDNPGIPTVNGQERDLVLLIYKTYLETDSYKRTAEALNQRGYRTKSYTSRRGVARGGQPFKDTTISRTLRNPFYVGKVRHKDERYDGQHEPIVPVELWERVQRVIDGKGGDRNRQQNLHLFRLQGLVRCGECGSYMSPYYGYGRGRKPYFYYRCTKRQHQGSCSMANVPASPLEDVIVQRLQQLSKQDRTIEHLVKDAMAGTAELTSNLEQRRANLQAQRTEAQAKVDALVESIADRRAVKSVAKRLVALEEQSEQLDDEILDLDLEMEATKRKAVNAGALSASLTTFGDLYQEATPEEQRELIQLRVNQLVWTPDEIRLSLLDGNEAAVSAVQCKATVGSPYGIRTRATAVRGRRPRPLDERAT
jgi:site-specific DNA recombinase